MREQLEGTLGCGEAELAISRQLDGMLPRSEKGALRAHLRACPECATFARKLRAQRPLLKEFALIPLPSSVASFFGGGATTLGTGTAAFGGGLAVKAALVGSAAFLAVSGSFESVKQQPARGGLRLSMAAPRASVPRVSAIPTTAARLTPIPIALLETPHVHRLAASGSRVPTTHIRAQTKRSQPEVHVVKPTVALVVALPAPVHQMTEPSRSGSDVQAQTDRQGKFVLCRREAVCQGEAVEPQVCRDDKTDEPCSHHEGDENAVGVGVSFNAVESGHTDAQEPGRRAIGPRLNVGQEVSLANAAFTNRIRCSNK